MAKVNGSRAVQRLQNVLGRTAGGSTTPARVRGPRSHSRVQAVQRLRDVRTRGAGSGSTTPLSSPGRPTFAGRSDGRRGFGVHDAALESGAPNVLRDAPGVGVPNVAGGCRARGSWDRVLACDGSASRWRVDGRRSRAAAVRRLRMRGSMRGQGSCSARRRVRIACRRC